MADRPRILWMLADEHRGQAMGHAGDPTSARRPWTAWPPRARVAASPTRTALSAPRRAARSWPAETPRASNTDCRTKRVSDETAFLALEKEHYRTLAGLRIRHNSVLL